GPGHANGRLEHGPRSLAGRPEVPANGTDRAPYLTEAGSLRAMRHLSFAASAAMSTVLGCGAGSGACTEIGCEHEAVVTFPPALVDGPYDLVLRGEAETATARCADPGAPETADNPAGLSCDLSGFTLTGHPLANVRAVFVTVVRVEDDETLVD